MGLDQGVESGLGRATGGLIEKYIVPIMSSLYKTATHEKRAISTFKKYIERAQDKYKYLSTIVFQNRKKELLDLYIPLHIQKKPKAKGDDPIIIEKFNEIIFSKSAHILITDSAGMGKSTLLKFLLLKALDQLACIPILIELRRIKSNLSLNDCILQEVNGDSQVLDFDEIIKICNSPQFVFLFDGLDEVSANEYHSANEQISRFSEQLPNARIILTSRPDLTLSSHSSYLEFQIKPLSREDAYALIRKYDPENIVAISLIDTLNKSKTYHDFLTNPLIVSLLFKAYESKSIIPLKRHIFFRQVYDALYDNHDLTKAHAYARSKKSSLDCEDFHRILRGLGMLSIHQGKIEFTRDEFASIVEAASKRLSNKTFNTNDFIDDVTKAVPMFKKEGNAYIWTHKSFQDYFAAQYIQQEALVNCSEIFDSIINSKNVSRFENMMLLFAEINPALFKMYFTAPVIDLILKDMHETCGGRLQRKSDVEIRIAFIISISTVLIFPNQNFAISFQKNITQPLLFLAMLSKGYGMLVYRKKNGALWKIISEASGVGDMVKKKSDQSRDAEFTNYIGAQQFKELNISDVKRHLTIAAIVISTFAEEILIPSSLNDIQSIQDQLAKENYKAIDQKFLSGW